MFCCGPNNLASTAGFAISVVFSFFYCAVNTTYIANGFARSFQMLTLNKQSLKLNFARKVNLAERLRAAGAGIGGFFCPTGYGTELAKGKETRLINGRWHVYEEPIHGDVALIKAERGDRWGNLTYRMAARNFGPVMATAARTTIASVFELAELGELDPETIVTPGIHVRRVVVVPRSRTEAGGFKA